MKRIAIALATATALLASPAVSAKTPKLTGEQKLAKLLEGRVAGKPVDCINLHASRNARIIDKTAIVYDNGGTIYVNRPVHASTLDDDDIMVTKPTSGQLCSVDTVQLRDRSQFGYSGFVGLSKFVPYRRIDRVSQR